MTQLCIVCPFILFFVVVASRPMRNQRSWISTLQLPVHSVS